MSAQAEILPMEAGKVAIYNPFRAQLTELKEQNKKMLFEYESKEGNRAARSYIYQLRLTKGAVEKARKEEKKASLDYGRKVDTEAEEITAALDAMIEVHQKAIDEIEQREKDRINAMERRIANITRYQQCAGHDSQETANAIAELKAIVIDESYSEFEEKAKQQKEIALQMQEAEHAAALKREADARELERLRKESAEREQRDRDERMRQEAAQKAEADAQRRLEIAAREKADAEAAAQRSEVARILAEKQAKDAAIIAAAKAENDKQEAIQKERERIEADKRAEAEAQAKREADKAHRAQINNEVLQALLFIPESGLCEETAKNIIRAISKGEVKHVSILY